MKFLKRIIQGFSALIALLLIILLASLLFDSYQTTYLKVEKQAEADNKSYFIKNVNIIPMSSDTVLSNSSIKIINGVIISIGDSLNAENLNVIDGMNYFLSPGLIDMHVHVWDQYELGLYLANGVTTIRNLWGQPMHLRMKKDISEEDIIAPVFFTSSPKLTGPEFIGDDNLNLTEPADAKEKVISYQERGYDFIKTYYGLTENLFEAILEQADISNMDIVAHPTPNVPYAYHFNPQIITIEHAEEFVQQPLHYQLDTVGLNEIIRGYAANPHSTLCPTLIGYYNILNMLMDDENTEPAKLEFMNPLIRMTDSETQKERWNNTKESDPSIVGRIKDQHDFHLLIVKKLHESGVNIVCGTDAGIGITAAGYSIHQELDFYSQAGLSNYEVIKTATLNPSKTHEFMNELGSIELGKMANFVLTKQNPLEILETLRNPRMVMVKGRKINMKQLKLFEDKARNRSNLIATAIRYVENLLVEK